MHKYLMPFIASALFSSLCIAGTNNTMTTQCKAGQKYTTIHLKKADGTVVDARVQCKDQKGLEKGNTVELV